jgi:hypothetical protein
LFSNSLALESIILSRGINGNDFSIILVSSNYTILHVLRTFRPNVPADADPTKFQTYEVGAHYAVLEQHFRESRTYQSMTMTRLQTILKANVQIDEEEEDVNALMPQGPQSDKTKKSIKKKKEVKNTIRKALFSGAPEYGGQLVEQIIRQSQIDGNTLISQISLNGISYCFAIDKR